VSSFPGTGAFNSPNTNRHRSNVAQASLSYVSGAHSFKVGFQDRWGWTTATRQDVNGDLGQQYRSGVPFAVTIINTPSIVLERATETSLLARLSEVELQLTTTAGTCLFRGPIGVSITNGVATGNQLGNFVPYASGSPCNNPIALAGISLTLSRALSYTGTA